MYLITSSKLNIKLRKIITVQPTSSDGTVGDSSSEGVVGGSPNTEGVVGDSSSEGVVGGSPLLSVGS